jgi:hypothetical protein
MKKTKIFAFLLAAASAGFMACDGEETIIEVPSPPVTPAGTPIVELRTNISSNYTLSNDTIYHLEGRIFVLNGATLTIEPGTIIKGGDGEGAAAKALIVSRGSKIMAMGTAQDPIIMTSKSDEIDYNSALPSPNLTPTSNGRWGGLIVLGAASSSLKGDATEQSIEGIPADDPNGKYGGSTDDDNSGVIQYVSIRHGGSNIGEGNEINGLTLAGVGSGTVVDHIEIIANQDDGLEIFGGTVNVNDVLVWNQGDDAFDMDQEWQGTLDNFIGVLGEISDHALELDGAEGADNDLKFTMTNGTLLGFSKVDDGETVFGGSEFIDLRSNVKANLSNIAFIGFGPDADIELDNNGVAANWVGEDIMLTNIQIVATGRTVEDVFVDKSDDGTAFTSRARAGVSVVSAATVGADVTEFTGWTWADAAGGLNSLK